MGRKPTTNLNLPPRMRARKRPSGVYYFYDTGERPRREIPLGKDYLRAVQEWTKLEIQADATRRAPLVTFRDLADRYMREVLPTKAPRTQRDNHKELAKLLEFFNEPPAPISEIRPIHVRQYLDWRKDAPVRANREKALFSHIWNTARNAGIIELPNPCDGIKGYQESGRDNYVDENVFQAVYECADQPTRFALDLAYLAAQRPADTLKITEADIKDGALAVKQNKTQKRLRVALFNQDGTPNALGVLIEQMLAFKRQNPIHSANLICNEQGQGLTSTAFRYRFDKARDLASARHPNLAEAIKRYQYRDLRATAATDTENLVGMQAAQDLLGHESPTMTKHYVRNRMGKLVNPTKK